MHWLPGPEVALRWLTNSEAASTSLWSTYTAVPLGISHYKAPTPPGEDFPIWAESYHRIAMVRRRLGDVRFAPWERPMDVVADIRDLAILVYQVSPQT
jgi:hypothetical protein